MCTVKLLAHDFEDDGFREELARPHNPRRSSLPSSDLRSKSLTTGAPISTNPLTVIPSEATPLLRDSTVPIVQENGAYTGGHKETTTMIMFWKELYLLAKSTLPVFR